MLKREEPPAPKGLKNRVTLSGQTSPITRISWSPDGRLLAVPSLGGAIAIWRTQSWELIFELNKGGGKVLSTAWSPDGQTLASGYEYAPVIRLWNMESGIPHKVFNTKFYPMYALAWAPSHDLIAAAGKMINVYDVTTGSACWGRVYHELAISLAWSPDGQALAVGFQNGIIRFFQALTGAEVSLKGHANAVSSLAWSSDGQTLVSASADRSIKVWDSSTKQEIISIEGHTGAVSSVSFLSDKETPLLASKSNDGTVRLWKCDVWENVITLDENPTHLSAQAANSWTSSLSFHPTKALLAASSENDSVVRIWELDMETISNLTSVTEFVHYISTKITLVGDSGVGKTGLGWRLANGEFKEQTSTHGEQFWFLNTLTGNRTDKTECEVILWDFAGQPDYRLIHALFLDDADIILLVFDPSNRQEPLKGVDYWLQAISHRKGHPCRTMLVGARADRGTPSLTDDEIDAFCSQRGIDGGYIGTSAFTGYGIPDLIERLKREIGQVSSTTTTTTVKFKKIKQYILTLKEGENKTDVLITTSELCERVTQAYPDVSFTESEIMTAVYNLAKHGYVRPLHTSFGENVILLAPDLLNNLAASFVLEARRNAKGLGALEETLLINREYDFSEIRDLKQNERNILLDAAIFLFLEHNICFRESLGNTSYLIFPALINQKKPILEEVKLEEDVSYRISGAVENVYASLVVLLGYTNAFKRTNQWYNQAQYEIDTGEVCGFRQIEEKEGEIDLVLYFAERASVRTKLIFQGLFETFLSRRPVNVSKYPPIICQKCDYRQERGAVVKRVKEGYSHLFCGHCGQQVELSKVYGEGPFERVDLEKRRVEEEAIKEIDEQRAIAKHRASFESALTWVKGNVRDKKPPTCFISYAWGNRKTEQWVAILADDLTSAGIHIILDKKDNAAIGSNIARFITEIHQSDFVIAVGTLSYVSKYKNLGETGSVVAAEMDLINTLLIGNETQKKSVLPVLLEGDEKSSLPPLMHGRAYADFRHVYEDSKHVHGDFRRQEEYFQGLFDLILTLYGLSLKSPVVAALRDSIRRVWNADTLLIV